MYMRLMRKQDIDQVSGIDREAFPTDWPPTNFARELDNRLAFYVVVTDQPPTPAPPDPQPVPNAGWWKGLWRWLIGEKQAQPPPEDRILGYAGMWVMADEAHVMSIATRRDERRRGVGEALIIALVELAQQHRASVVTLEVRRSNAPAQSLYTKYGFNNVGMRKGYYLDNKEDAIIMTTDHIESGPFRRRLERLKEEHERQWGDTAYDLERRQAGRPGA